MLQGITAGVGGCDHPDDSDVGMKNKKIKVHRPFSTTRHSNVQKVHRYGRTWQRIRERIIIRDKGMCVVCKESVTGRDAQVDHIKPVAKGGLDTEDNLQLLCATCHSTKTDTENKGWRLTLE